MIEIRNLYKYYGDRRAVGPLSAEIEAGEIVGLLGLNGAGKTTTLRVLACDLLPTSGSVTVGGVDVVERPDEVRAKIGYLPDSPPLYADMRVREFLSYAARLRGMAKTDVPKRVDEVLELTEIGEYADELISSLSHGFRQRVGIAQAIVHGPELVVLDEPISGLDPVQIVEMRELVRNLGGDHTVILSSHILGEISETCDRILVIRDGEIAESGTEAELSARLLRGMRVEVTVRAGQGDAERVLRALPAVREVEAIEAAEPGQVATYRVTAEGDVRDEAVRALVSANVAVLGLTRSGRELENVFLQLSEPEVTAAKKRRQKRPQRDRKRPVETAKAEEASS